MNSRFLIGETWGFPGASVEHLETHAAHVFLVGDRAFKIKKDVKLPYLDFSTVEKRKAVLEHELAINLRHAPQIYVNVIDKEGEPVLVMNRFDSESMLSRLVARGRLDDGLAGSLARTIAEAHAIAARAEAAGAAIMAGLGAQLSQAFTSSPDIFRAPETLEFHALFEEALKRLRPLLNRRSEIGLVRLCHGDMHCANIVVIGGRPTLFDAIEFSEKIATIDVLYDIAFLLMDLLRHNQPQAANIVLNRYLHLRRAHEDLSGLAALPLFLSTRAGVRALVTADLVHELRVSKSQYERGAALDYFRSSIAFLKPPKPELVCVGGLSGTGKSTLALALAPEVGAAPGAIHIRSDVERKTLAGVAETERLTVESYSRTSSLAVYEAIFARSEKALAAGHSVILDAVFAEPSERNAAAAIGLRQGASFRGLWLEARPDVLKARVSTRSGDASDADAAVVDRQLHYDIGMMTWSRVDASGSSAQTLETVRRMVPPPPAAPA
jgi:uncharacterized protein